MRVVIAGVPSAGKSTLAHRLGTMFDLPIHQTDSVISLGWSQGSEVVSTWMEHPGPWVIEGVACARALRKWLERHKDGRPCDLIAHMSDPFKPYGVASKGAATMAKGCRTVWAEISSDLLARGVILVPAADLGDRVGQELAARHASSVQHRRDDHTDRS